MDDCGCFNYFELLIQYEVVWTLSSFKLNPKKVSLIITGNFSNSVSEAIETSALSVRSYSNERNYKLYRTKLTAEGCFFTLCP